MRTKNWIAHGELGTSESASLDWMALHYLSEHKQELTETERDHTKPKQCALLCSCVNKSTKSEISNQNYLCTVWYVCMKKVSLGVVKISSRTPPK